MPIIKYPQRNVVQPPSGMHWHRHGNRWYLIAHDDSPYIVAYVTCVEEYRDCGSRYRYWKAVYRPDTTECLACATRQEAQRWLVHWLNNPPPEEAPYEEVGEEVSMTA